MKERRLPFRYLNRCFKILFTQFLILLFVQASYSQFQATETYTIVDQKGDPVPDVQIISKNYPNLQLFTDQQGKFLLSIPTRQSSINDRQSWRSDTLYFQKTGYHTLIIPRVAISSVEQPIVMKPMGTILDEVQVVGRSDWSNSRFAQEIELLNATEIEQLQGRSTADILESSGEVFVQRSQLGGGSPIIRGFEANRILLVVDGVRLNNAIYRSGHLHNSISVDQFGLSNIEIHAGPNSLLYGSDALGGVLHFKTKNASFLDRNFGLSEVNSSALYQSAANNWAGHLDFSFSGRKWSSYSSASFSRIGDLRAGSQRPDKYPDFGKRSFFVERIDGRDSVIENSDPNVQVGSGYDQFDLMQKLNFKPNDRNIFRLNLQLSDAPSPRYDQLALTDSIGRPEFAEWDYDPQRRYLASLSHDFLGQTTLFDRSKMIFSYQKIVEGRSNRKFNNDFRTTNTENLDVWSFSLDMVKSGKHRYPWRLYYGMESQVNSLNSEVKNKNINTGQERPTELTRYPSGDNHTYHAGMYAMVQTDLNTKNWNLDIGMRYSFYRVEMSYMRDDPFEWPEEFISGISNQGQYPTFSGAVTYQPLENWTMKAISSTAFRAPNIDDIAKVRIKNGLVLTPNVSLGPENAWNNEFSVQWRNENWTCRAVGFYNHINDIIVRTEGALPNGDTLIISNGDPYRVQVNENRDEGIIYGGSLDLQWRSELGWKASLSATKVIGRVLEENATLPLAHIPPLYGKASIGYQWNLWDMEIFTLFNGEKPLDEYAAAGSDNEEYATVVGTYAWWTMNGRISYKKQNLRASLRLENILDRHYRTFSSGISASGFNLALQLSYTFSSLE